MFRKIIAIAFLNFKEAMRDKLFNGAAIFFIFYLFFCVMLSGLSVGHIDKILRDSGLAGIELTTIFLIICSFTFSFYREKDSHILDIYFSYFKKSEYISGKILGYFFISLLYIILCGSSFALLLNLYNAFRWEVLTALYPMFLKVIIIICLSSIFCSLISSPAVALFAVILTYVSAEISSSAVQTIRLLGTIEQRFLTEFLYAFLPNMDKLDIKSLVVYDVIPPFTYFISITFYASLYTAFLWLINIFIFQRKEYR